MNPTLLFREDQRFRSPLLWIPLIGVTAFCCGTIAWMISRQVVQEIPFGEDAMSNGKMLALGGAVIALNFFLLALVASLKLQTEVTTAGLFLRFRPLQRKTRLIDMDGLTQVASVVYRPAMEYGGWGIRYGRRGQAYNVTGNLGVRLDYDNGYHLLIGTCQPEALKLAIDQMMAARGIACLPPEDNESDDEDGHFDEDEQTSEQAP